MAPPSDNSAPEAVVDEESSDDESTLDNNVRCDKLSLPRYLKDYLSNTCNGDNVTTLECDKDLVETVVSNYIIVKQIIAHLPWQDKMMCKQVCKTWRSAVQTLQKEQLYPEDFSACVPTFPKSGVKYSKSGTLLSEPLVIFTFTNLNGLSMSPECKSTSPAPCAPPCQAAHCALDIIQHDTCTPKDCMVTVIASMLSYMPLLESPTYTQLLTTRKFRQDNPFVCGLYIPCIPDVNFQVIHLNAKGENLKQDFYDVIDKAAQTRVFKGVVAFATEKYIFDSVEDIVFLNYFKEVQPDIPYALGGCIIEDAFSSHREIIDIIQTINERDEYVSANLISVGFFTIPKEIEGVEREKNNFEMFSLVIDSSDWSREKIEKTINEFSIKVPRFEHSVVLKLSCVGRDTKHDVEQQSFRANFPETRLIGCYGNGELGLNHPSRTIQEESVNKMKRRRPDTPEKPLHGIMYSYSTVFLYMGWGKIVWKP